MNNSTKIATIACVFVTTIATTACTQTTEKVSVAQQPDAYVQCVQALRQDDQVHGGSRHLLLETAQRCVARVDSGEQRTRMMAATATMAFDLGRPDVFNAMVDELDRTKARLILSSGPDSMDVVAALKDLRELEAQSKHLGPDARDQVRNARRNGMSVAGRGTRTLSGG